MQSLKGKRPQISALHAKEQVILQADQENVICCVAGFVPFKMLTKYKKRCSEDAAAIGDWLSDMAVPREESSFLAFTPVNGPRLLIKVVCLRSTMRFTSSFDLLRLI